MGLCGVLRELAGAEEEGECGRLARLRRFPPLPVPSVLPAPPPEARGGSDAPSPPAGLRRVRALSSCALALCHWLSSLHGSLFPHLSVRLFGAGNPPTPPNIPLVGWGRGGGRGDSSRRWGFPSPPGHWDTRVLQEGPKLRWEGGGGGRSGKGGLGAAGRVLTPRSPQLSSEDMITAFSQAVDW